MRKQEKSYNMLRCMLKKYRKRYHIDIPADEV